MKFLRRNAKRFAKFGKGKGKKAKWRNPTGRHNKIREGKKGYPASVKIGYKKTKVPNEKKIIIMNPENLEKTGKKEKAIVGNVGKKKRIEIVKKAQDLKIELANLNSKSFLKKLYKEKKLKEDKK
ncbi:hypothetical protein J4411_03295 [Candidatus Pacearchaeota archaeon]|nr:hypothetical protein [Candidatus Pacearchaeota archaeon]